MSLPAGTRLGPYEILAPLGAGGMGEVYKARDTRLERSVAVKVLPTDLAATAELKARFEREAKAISQLSHPHICALYDVGREGETEYLVMELLEGETLADRLSKGPLPLEQTLRCGIQISDALDKAHRSGIVHRDLKPGNVMITRSGVKLLDFGLAKAARRTTGLSDLSSLPTEAGRPLTERGTILGTFQYMSPEQLEGKEADARSDIFALGCVLYEMATGRKAFAGTSHASLVTAILSKDPEPISKVSPTRSAVLDNVVKGCLAKDPEDRWQSTADIKQLLGKASSEQAEKDPPEGVAIPRSRRRQTSLIPWMTAALAILLSSFALLRPRRPEPTKGRMQLSIVPQEQTVLLEFFNISPDGKTLAFMGVSGGKTLLRARELASEKVRSLAGTDSAETVFWSPDSRFLGFISRGKLRRIEVSTGSIESLADAELGRGGSWGPNGDILFTGKAMGVISRVPASGGNVTPVTKLERGDLLHRWPQFLPDGKRFLFFVKTAAAETTGTYVGNIEKAGRQLLLRNGATGVFLPPNVLLFVRGETLLAQHVDLNHATLEGEPEEIAHPIMRGDLGSYRDLFTVSESGVLVFRAGSAERRLIWVDRGGNETKAVGLPAEILSVNLSPDDHTAGYTFWAKETGSRAIGMVDLERDVTMPFAQPAALPVWAPNGQSIFYRSEVGPFEIRRRTVRGDARDEQVGVVDSFATPQSISSDGRYLLYSRVAHDMDIGMKDLEAEAEPRMMMTTEFSERTPFFSPDGHWFVYSSDETGQSEIFVRRFPMTDEKWRISTSGGEQPLWGRDGREIFFMGMDRKLMTVPVKEGAEFSAGHPQSLFQTSVMLDSVGRQYAPSSDGRRFLIIAPTQDFGTDVFRVLLNWR
jgi:serine/threonine protein kinase